MQLRRQAVADFLTMLYHALLYVGCLPTLRGNEAAATAIIVAGVCCTRWKVKYRNELLLAFRVWAYFLGPVCVVEQFDQQPCYPRTKS